MNTPVKLLMTWDIRPGQEERYFAFITEEFPSAFHSAGLELTDAWYTVYGTWPQVTMGFAGADLLSLEQFLGSADWGKLKEQLLAYILHYRQKVVRARGGYQL